MTETELLRLPEIPEGPPAEQLKAVKRYLCRLAEQLEYILTNERRERVREQEQSRTLEDRLAASPKVAEGILAASSAANMWRSRTTSGTGPEERR